MITAPPEPFAIRIIEQFAKLEILDRREDAKDRHYSAIDLK